MEQISCCTAQPRRCALFSGQRGEVAKRLTAPVLKTGRVQALVGSNPTLSANWTSTRWGVGRLKPEPVKTSARRKPKSDIPIAIGNHSRP